MKRMVLIEILSILRVILLKYGIRSYMYAVIYMIVIIKRLYKKLIYLIDMMIHLSY